MSYTPNWSWAMSTTHQTDLEPMQIKTIRGIGAHWQDRGSYLNLFNRMIVCLCTWLCRMLIVSFLVLRSLPDPCVSYAVTRFRYTRRRRNCHRYWVRNTRGHLGGQGFLTFMCDWLLRCWCIHSLHFSSYSEEVAHIPTKTWSSWLCSWLLFNVVG